MIQKVLALFLTFGLLCGFSFNERWARYPRPDEILLLFQDRFPLGFERGAAGAAAQQCNKLTSENRSFLGDNRPDDGKPMVNEPNLHFVKWYAACLAEVVAQEVTALNTLQKLSAPGTMDPALLAWIPVPETRELQEEFLRFLQRSNTGTFLTPLSTMSKDFKEYIVAKTVVRLIGPDVLIDEKPPLFNAKAFRARILKNVETIDFSSQGFRSMGLGNSLAGNESTILGFLTATMLITSLQDEFLIQ